MKLEGDSTSASGAALRAKCFRFEILQRSPELSREEEDPHPPPSLSSPSECSDAAVPGFLTHSFMHLQLFHDAFDVTSYGHRLSPCTRRTEAHSRTRARAARVRERGMIEKRQSL